MKGFKILALTAAMSALSVSAFALESVDEETLSATTGQAGITIALDNGANEANAGITVDHLRWRDGDGFGATYTNAGMVDVANLKLWGQTTVALDVGTDPLTGNTGLNVNLTLNNVGFNFGQLSLVDGDTYGLTDNTIPAAGYQTFGTLSVSNINLPGSMNLLITAGGQSGDGITIQTSGFTSLSMDVDFHDTTDDGHIMTNVAINGMSGSTMTIDSAAAGQTVGSVTAGANGALVLGMSNVDINSVALTNVVLGDAAGPSLGDFALVGIHVLGSNLMISSH